MEKDKKIFKIISLILLIISICFNFSQWYYDYKIFGYKIYSQKINIKPSFITTLSSLLIFGGFIMRNIGFIINDIWNIVFYVLDIFFFLDLLLCLLMEKLIC